MHVSVRAVTERSAIHPRIIRQILGSSPALQHSSFFHAKNKRKGGESIETMPRTVERRLERMLILGPV
jgi:hypothetical protein